jgi:hypothetical protein
MHVAQLLPKSVKACAKPKAGPAVHVSQTGETLRQAQGKLWASPTLDGAAEAAPFQNGERLYAALKRRSSTVAPRISFMHKFRSGGRIPVIRIKVKGSGRGSPFYGRLVRRRGQASR